MFRSPEAITDLFTSRQKHYAPLHAGMETIRSIYRNQATVELPGKDGEDEAVSVPNLLAQGIDQMAGRVASVTPMVAFSAERPGIRGSERKAETARRVLTGWWQSDRLMLKMKVRARRLLAYSMSPVKICYDFQTGRPTWQVRDPLETFPSPSMFSDTFVPVDCIFAYRRSVKWLVDHGYTEAVRVVAGVNTLDSVSRDTEMLMLEYVDDTGSALVLTGTVRQPEMQPGMPSMMPTYGLQTGNRSVLLSEYDHLTPTPCTTVPTRIALDGPQGQFDNMVSMYHTEARLMALEIAAVEKGIFPDTWLVSRQGEIAQIIDGPHDGRTGLVNVASGGDIKTLNESPGYMTTQTIDRLERASRLTAGIPPDFSGESSTNVRTGRRGDALLSSVIDFPLAEAQDVFANALADENRIAIALAKQYDGTAPKSIFVGTGNDARKVTYVATEVFTHDEHVVTYPISGTDLNELMLGGGQRVGLGTMSKRTLAEMDPMIASPELEHDRIIGEGLEEALLEGLKQQAAGGQLPPLVLAKVMDLVTSDQLELAEALTKVTEDAAKAQAAQQQQTGPPTADQMMAPAAQQAMTGSAAVPGVPSGIDQLGQALGQLRHANQAPTPIGA